jgi:uncharacterized protein YajQ (UPF0234 family)
MAKGDNSFDVACKVDPQAVADAVHQATREVQTRYDLKQTKTELGLEKDAITVHTDNDYVLKQVLDVLQSKLHRRSVPLKALSYGKVEPAAGGTVRQRIDVQQGIPMDKAKEIVRLIKDMKLKVQAQIQEDHVRVFGKNRDDLQAVIKTLREQDLGIEMQFTNYRSEEPADPAPPPGVRPGAAAPSGASPRPAWGRRPRGRVPRRARGAGRARRGPARAPRDAPGSASARRR